ncbi:unnamed protein product [Diatraea saccharalis]|uniref:Uncharacterized protein n=1 Tax=Diatraea saccharalis TaxID=40085 RepID=A0A9N9WB41_9NEOP|nr:unnamed protein product [Diatraea saccharalis]
MGIFYMIILIDFIFCVYAVSSHDRLHALSDEFIDYINFNQNTWIAGRNFHKKTPLKNIYVLMGTYRDYHNTHREYTPRRNYTSLGKRRYPKNFDARNHWQHCPSLNDIRDQGSCGSCWAVAAASAMTDRGCIHSNGKKNFYFSSQDVLSCVMAVAVEY